MQQATAITALVKTPTRRFVAESLLVGGITTAIALVSQRWTGLDTPDSSFYLSLSLFGAEITDRVAEPYYAWTRLGAILPVRALTQLLGTYPGLEAYRFLLLLLCTTGAYLALRRFAQVWIAGLFTLLILLNTVILGYLGNPYLTRGVLAGTFVIIATALVATVRNQRWRSPTPRAAFIGGSIAGAILGWLVMTNPYGAILAGSIWLTLVIAATIAARNRPQALRAFITQVITAALATLVVWALFLFGGRLTFPRLDWLQTYLTWNARLTYSDFASANPVWLGDISLLVPVMILVITACVWLRNRRLLAAQLALLLAALTIVATFALFPIMGGITLEAPMYQAMLWPPCLLALTLSATAAITRTPTTSTAPITPALTWPSAVAGLAAVIIVAIAGRWPGVLPLGIGLALVLLLAALAGVTWTLRPPTTIPTPVQTIAVLITLGLVLGGAQLLQNSRRDLGLYFLSPYANAFLNNPIETKVRTAMHAQEFVLANTRSSDRIQLWVGGDWAGGDRELYAVAGMQMWGPNIATLQPTLDTAKADELRLAAPNVLLMVAPTMEQVLAFWSSLPSDAQASAPSCYDYAWPGKKVQTGHSCLTTLNWATTQ